MARLAIALLFLSTTWNLEASTLPQNAKWFIGAYCNITESIWIFGGSANARSVTSFDPTKTTDAVSTHSAASSDFKYYARNRIYDGIYYFSFQGSSYISQFFTSTISFNYQFAQHPYNYTNFHAVPYKTGSDFVIFCQGDSTVKELHILNVPTLNWNQGQSYTSSAVPVIANRRMYHISEYFAEYLDISGSIEDIIYRNWQTSNYTGSSLQYRTSQITAFYNKYSRNYELWAWGGYSPSYQQSGIRVIDTATFEVISVPTFDSTATWQHAFIDALSVYVDFQDKWYVIAGHYGFETNMIYSVDYDDTYSPTRNPIIVTMNSTPTVLPSSIPTFIPSNAPFHDFHPITTMTTFSDDERSTSTMKAFTTFVLISCAAVVLICAVCILFWWIYYRTLSETEDTDNNLSHLVNDNKGNAAVPLDKNAVKNVELEPGQHRERVYTESQHVENEANEDSNPSHEKHVQKQNKNENVNELEDVAVNLELPQDDEPQKKVSNVDHGADNVKEWLTNKVKLPQYYDVLIENGFESLNFVKAISKKEDLNDIGITLKEHQLQFMMEIKKL